mmetsp:Transcript_92460/g.160599  ORF Transcript_92460/g.160599 Transcript_92460/m.160599 type:complete len:441 (-) Transcript_92460:80-1402(-)
MAALKRVILASGDAPSLSAKKLVEVKVDASSPGCLEDLRTIAQAELELHAKSFEFVYGDATIDTCAALKHALDESGGNACVLGVRDHSTPKEQGLETRRSLTSRMRAMEDHVEALEEKIEAKLREMMKVGTLAHLVQHVCQEQMDARLRLNEFDVNKKYTQSRLREIDEAVAALKLKVDSAAVDLAATIRPEGPKTATSEDLPSSSSRDLASAFAQLDELCCALTCKLEATSCMEADISQKFEQLDARAQSAEDSIKALRADVQTRRHANDDEVPTLKMDNEVSTPAAAFALLDELCQQLTCKLEVTSGMESDIREQIAEVRNRAQNAEDTIEALRAEVYHTKEPASPKAHNILGEGSKPFQHLKRDFGLGWQSSLGSTIDLKAGLNCAPVAYSAKLQRKLQLKGEQYGTTAVPFALQSSACELDRVASCPTLPPLSPAR